MMGRKRPIIGVTKPEAKRINLSFIVLWLAIWFNGGRPKILSYKEDIEHQDFDGLLLGGGTDVFPGLFFKDPKENYQYDRLRDDLEIRLLKKADKDHIPVFAICRGAQLMNVVNGGSLHLDIATVYEGANYPQNVIGYLFFKKKINIKRGTLLHEIIRKEELMVNSIHNQSIDRIGEGLSVSSREPNGIIQSIERPGERFYLGVQFHPERLIHRSQFRRIFKSFIQEAKNINK
jgi:putative glutamine amidotransferase